MNFETKIVWYYNSINKRFMFVVLELFEHESVCQKAIVDYKVSLPFSDSYKYKLAEKVYVVWEDKSKVYHKIRFNTTEEAKFFIKSTKITR
jgi:hypothetical protein